MNTKGGHPHSSSEEAVQRSRRERIDQALQLEAAKESLEEYWVRLRGAKPIKSESEKQGSPFAYMAEWIMARHTTLTWGTAFALACVFALAIYFKPLPADGPIQLSMLPGGQRTGYISLPKYLRLENGKIAIFEGEDRLTGTAVLFNPTTAKNLTVYQIDLTGTDSAGVNGRVYGTLTLTNVIGVTTIKSNTDTTGALLDVRFEIEGIATNDFKESFAP